MRHAVYRLDYIKGRRLTYAAYDLFYTRLRIVEIAIKYHFSSQEAFTRSERVQFHEWLNTEIVRFLSSQGQ
ncbi:Transposon Tn10 TetD protein [compost metagenome]